MTIQKLSNATVVQSPENQTIRIISSYNPEKIFIDSLKTYLDELGYSSMFPNFKSVRIGNIHPFAITLLQDVLGQKVQTDMFPSITVADSTDTAVNQVLNLDVVDIKLTDLAWSALQAEKVRGRVHISDENETRVTNALAEADIYGIQYSHFENHTFDFNIWGENKDVVSFLYDMVKEFLFSNINQFKEEGISIQGEISGRRSGDINVEFGKLLYGANISVQGMLEVVSLELQLPVDYINSVIVEPIT